MSNKRSWACPYYITMLENSGGYHAVISCEAADIKLPDQEAVKDWAGRYCGNAKCWADCPLAKLRSNFYERS